MSSFDVFDTAITRTYSSPEDLLWHLGEILTEKKLVRDAACFFHPRRDSERIAWQKQDYRKGIGIAEIYSILAEKLCWNAAEMKRALEEEVRLETAAARAVPDTQVLLHASHARGRNVCFVSDMYLSSSHLQAILSRLDIAQPGDAIFVSSDTGETKRSGRLFEVVLRSLSLEARRLSHIGDHLHSDFKVPRRKGIKARLYTRAQLNRYEHNGLKQIEASDWRMRSMASASRFCRLARAEAEPESRVRDLLCSTIAPFVAGYVIWLLAQASARGVKKLFFMARDMQIVHEVAGHLVKARGLDIECIYIHASRVAWQSPAYSSPNDFEMTWLTDHLPDARMESVLRRLVSEADLEALKSQGGESSLDGDSRDRSRLHRLLQASPVCTLVREETAKRRKAFLGYLAEKGYRPDRSCALVDAGWRGTLQKCLARAYKMETDSVPEVTGFYLGLRDQATPEEGSELHPFLADELIKKHGYSLVALVESFLTANHGTTLGYQFSAGHRAVLAAAPPEAFLRQWNLVRECCLSYADQLQSCAAFETDPKRLSGALIQPFILLCTDPAPEDAQLLSEWLYDAGRDSPMPKRIAAPLDFTELLKLLRYKLRRAPLADTYLSSPWLHGAIEASSPLARWLARRLLSKN